MIRKSIFSIALLAPAAMLVAADMIPIKQGIYVPKAVACKGASRADMVNYWGGKSSIGSGMAGCEIRKISHQGNVYRYTDVCTDVASGATFDGDETTLTVLGPDSFSLGSGKDATTYKYCGARPQ